MRIKLTISRSLIYPVGIFVIVSSVLMMFLGYLIKDINILCFFSIIFIVGYYLTLCGQQRSVFLDPMCIMPSVATIYCLTTPMIGACLNLVSFLSNISRDILIESTFYCEIYIIFFSILTLVIRNPINIDNIGVVFDAHRKSINIIVELYMWIFTFIVFLRYYQIGGLSVNLSSVVRNSIIDSFNTIPFYSYQCYIFIGCSIYNTMSFFNSIGIKKKARHIFGLIPVVLFFAINIFSGNRRELSYYIIAIFVYTIYKNRGKINRKIVVIGVSVFVALIALSFLRTYTSTDEVSRDMRVYTLLGEFVNPMYTLRYYMSKPTNLRFGLTYLGFIPMLIPKILWANKPISLASEYVKTTNAGIGYGFMPETEAFINFGFWGCIIGAVLHFVVCRYVCKNPKRHPYLFVALYCELLNMFRGEFSSTFTEMIIISLSLVILDRLNNPRKMIYDKE